LLLNAAIDTENNQLLRSWTLNRMNLMAMLKSRAKPTDLRQCISISTIKPKTSKGSGSQHIESERQIHLNMF